MKTDSAIMEAIMFELDLSDENWEAIPEFIQTKIYNYFERTTPKPDAGIKEIRCIVAALDPNGEADLYFVKVRATEDQVSQRKHYDAAFKAAEENDFEPRLAYDEYDSAGARMLELFEWDSASTVDA